MSSQEGSIEHIHRSQVTPDSFSFESGQNLDQAYIDQCEQCLKSSLKKEGGKTFVDSKKAIEKIELLKEATMDQDIKQKLNQLTTVLSQDNTVISSTQQLKTLIDQAFSEAISQEFNNPDKGVEVSLNQSPNNPFKQKNPFAPKVLEASESQETNQHQSRDKKEHRKVDKIGDDTQQ